jgi:hypothetical protein
MTARSPGVAVSVVDPLAGDVAPRDFSTPFAPAVSSGSDASGVAVASSSDHDETVPDHDETMPDHDDTASSRPVPLLSDERPLPERRYLAALEPSNRHGKPLADAFANLQSFQCRAELRKRKIVVRAANQPAPGVITPIRLAGTVGPLRFVTPGPKSPYGILDCRLAALFAELGSRLSSLSVKEVYVDNFYRRNAHLPGKKALPSQHALGLAVDIAGFGLTDGTVLNVERDFHGAIGSPVCGPDAVLTEATRHAILLRNIVCEFARLGAFNYLLTPNYDVAHRNHLHADIKRNTRDHVVR